MAAEPYRHEMKNPGVSRFAMSECGTCPVVICFTLAVCCIGATSARGEGPTAEKRPDNLTTILHRQTRIAFETVTHYVKQNPQAEDVDRAYAWLFETARRYGFEAAALPLAEDYLKRPETDESTGQAARRMKVLGQAATGKMDEALLGFQRELRDVSLRSPNATVDFALELTALSQRAGDFDAARLVLEQLSRAFFLNPYVRTLCENRLARLELADRPAPEIEVNDFDGRPVKLSDYEGKLLLVDFWATNCAPCLEEFPQMKQLYAEYRTRGLEIVGISLDEDRALVDEFQKTWKLPWRLALSSSDGDGTRQRYQARTIPATYLVDRKGRIVRIDVRGHNLRRSVEQLLQADD